MIMGCGYEKLTQTDQDSGSVDSGTKQRTNIKAYSECSPSQVGAYGCSFYGYNIKCYKVQFPEGDAGSFYYVWATDGSEC